MHWLEISFTLDGELAEAVADILARHVPQGVSIESTQIESSPDDEGRPVGPVRVRGFLPADDPATLEETRSRIERDLFYLGMIRPIPPPAYARVADADWAELWKAHYRPIRVGRRLHIVPAWLADSAPRASSPQSAVAILMDPGMAFGTGTHPTTQLCLELLEAYLQPGDAVLDVGCGSGILSVAAAKLGAGRLLGLDVDPEADRATRENATLNGVGGSIEFRLGSIETVLETPSSAAGGDARASQFSIVLANILARVILKLLDDGLARTLAPGGTVILSGILEEQSAEVIAALDAAGLQSIARKQRNDWIALAARFK